MIRVRFSTGLVLQYNSANVFEQKTGNVWLWTADKDPRSFIAQVPNDCVVEYVEPCRVYRENGVSSEVEVAAVEQKLRRALAVNRELRAAAKKRGRR